MRSITPDLDIPTTMNIDHTFIYPHLIYGVEFFGHAENFHLNQIYLLQKSALCVILAIRPRNHVSSYFSEFKGFTLFTFGISYYSWRSVSRWQHTIMCINKKLCSVQFWLSGQIMTWRVIKGIMANYCLSKDRYTLLIHWLGFWWFSQVKWHTVGYSTKSDWLGVLWRKLVKRKICLKSAGYNTDMWHYSMSSSEILSEWVD